MNPNESHIQYRGRVLNAVSPSFCGAKWLNATIWLGNGTTASCHHPPAHKIDSEAVLENPRALHNTPIKKAARQQMLTGERPSECEYCWKIEDLGSDQVSDRVYKSMIYTDAELAALQVISADADVDLKTLEIAFDANCNFACTYCNFNFSTTWQSELHRNGLYQQLETEGAGAYAYFDPKLSMPYGQKNEGNPYVTAFWKWWNSSLQYTLQELRITGGEATMSPDFWRLLEWWTQHPECTVALAVNTNLGAKPELIDKLIQQSHQVQKFDLYTSCEAHGPAAEYIRDGLVWNHWLGNLERALRYGHFKHVNVMMTISVLCLPTIVQFLDEMLVVKRRYGRARCYLSLNILRFPSFQSVTTLSLELREQFALCLEQWLARSSTQVMLLPTETDNIRRLIEYLREVEQSHRGAGQLEARQRDFKSFIRQYDRRRGKDFSVTFPDLAEWYHQLPEPRTIIPILSE